MAGGWGNFALAAGVIFTSTSRIMPATAPSPKKKAAPAKGGAAPKPAPKPTKKSNFIPNYFKGKIIVHPEFFDAHDRPENWPSGK